MFSHTASRGETKVRASREMPNCLIWKWRLERAACMRLFAYPTHRASFLFFNRDQHNTSTKSRCAAATGKGTYNEMPHLQAGLTFKLWQACYEAWEVTVVPHCQCDGDRSEHPLTFTFTLQAVVHIELGQGRHAGHHFNTLSDFRRCCMEVFIVTGTRSFCHRAEHPSTRCPSTVFVRSHDWALAP